MKAATFFYGLFMDQDLLVDKGFHPSKPVLAYVDDYGLRIGERATLVKAPGERAYGTVMTLPFVELDALYGAAGVADYVPEELVALDSQGIAMQVRCYNLPADKLAGRNHNYAESLSEVAERIGLPPHYFDAIARWL